MVKNHLARIVYPFVEATSDVHGKSLRITSFLGFANDILLAGHNSTTLQYLANSMAPSASRHRILIGETFKILNSVLPRIDVLVSHSNVAMSDAITIQAVYIAIGPFFVVEGAPVSGGRAKANAKTGSVVLNALGGPSAFKGLRLTSLSLIRSVSA